MTVASLSDTVSFFPLAPRQGLGDIINNDATRLNYLIIYLLEEWYEAKSSHCLWRNSMKSLTCNYGVISAISQVKYCLMQVLALKIITSFSESESSPDHWISENIDGTPWIWMRATTEDHIGVTIVSRLEDGR